MEEKQPNDSDASKPRQNDEGKPFTELRELLESHRGEYHAVVMQDYPDPDAIASAFAHKLISKEFDIQVDIIHSGRISHQQNIALVKLLGIELLPSEEIDDFGIYDGSIFVDNQGTTCEEIVEALEAADVPPLVIVDHHEIQERLNPAFSDIRRDVGSTATIFTQYLEEGNLVELDKSSREHTLVATALFHGLLTDTGNFTRANRVDFLAAGFLSVFWDPELLEQIMSQQRSKQTIEIIHKSAGDRIVVENYSIAGIGYVRAENRDAIPQAADFLLTEEYIHTTIVYGIVIEEDDQETLIGSMRTSKFTLDPDEFIKDVFGKDASGHHFGGGKISAGGFKIPIGFLSGDGGEEYQNLKWKVYDKQIKDRIFAKIGVENNANRQSHEAQ